jgi:hypothetical protein
MPAMRRRSSTILLAVLLAPGAPAFADGELDRLITPADRARLDRFEETRAEALEEARSGDPVEVAKLHAVIGESKLSFGDWDMVGDWKCRVSKLGGLQPLVTYAWFRCRVADDGSGWRLEKLSGSQRTTGRFYTDADDRLVYLGSLSVNEEKPRPYGSGRRSDQVGYAFRTGPAAWRIELPAPAVESKFDIIEFSR